MTRIAPSRRTLFARAATVDAAPAPHDHQPDDHHGGLAVDLPRLLATMQSRRGMLGLLTGAGTAMLVGCGGGGSDSSSTSSSGSTTTTTTTDTTSSGSTTTTTTTTSSSDVSSCSVIPEETAGPYPGDGSNTSNGSVANALALSGIVRSDIRTSIGGASGTAAGVPLTVKLRLVNTNGSCADLSGYAIYLWHCTRDGLYSMYSSGVTSENYLRGVQATDSDGYATFTTIFPGCYSGRMPHIHFEVYRSTTTATSFSNKLKTSQLAFPTDVCNTVYATSGYSASVRNLASISFSTDNVFSDGVTTQLATVTGNVSDGYVATLVVGISV
ncbi:intradiol ring-cleavage dioxygenase [Aquincola tertiaricarbonis]|uniref:Intradiol ring-cleavage dioxygenase n=1 Tax=Aquincola tertiaricarbonis TaxID=391953 RepID=A0ABY4SAL8_AQUTE|nr:intradiol ring-cleavage dioxygenase [Aquincola tertiaricarbonis]URI10033.1 intradiol ring-cleavage dioxygenase [Aquincola tertiaricarbonis]